MRPPLFNKVGKEDSAGGTEGKCARAVFFQDLTAASDS